MAIFSLVLIAYYNLQSEFSSFIILKNMELRNHGIMESWNHGIMESRNHGITESRNHGIMDL
jgi:hypothetical protein